MQTTRKHHSPSGDRRYSDCYRIWDWWTLTDIEIAYTALPVSR